MAGDRNGDGRLVGYRKLITAVCGLIAVVVLEAIGARSESIDAVLLVVGAQHTASMLRRAAR